MVMNIFQRSIQKSIEELDKKLEKNNINGLNNPMLKLNSTFNREYKYNNYFHPLQFSMDILYEEKLLLEILKEKLMVIDELKKKLELNKPQINYHDLPDELLLEILKEKLDMIEKLKNKHPEEDEIKNLNKQE